MRMMFGLVLLVGIGLAGFAVYMAQGYISENQAALEAERAARGQIVPTVQVFVLTKPVRYGERIGPKDVRTVMWPEDSVPPGAFLFSDEGKQDLFPEGSDELRAALRAMEKNEPILAVKVSQPGEDAGVASSLKAGMRAFSIRVDVASGVAGFLRPGDFIDVYWTGRGGQDLNQDITKLIDSSIKIIGIDQTDDGDRSNAQVARTVTVEVTPRQVAALAQAQATGQLSLSLVGIEDETKVGALEIDQRELLGIEERQVVEVEREKVCTVRTRRGAEVIDIPIACTN
ncbi:MAG: Flp pilus assembly protein CpaB [Rhodobacteraceae bacterium]|nr:Flp pilus assembly protein CpaB [Paracoccaceae bacterium]